MINSVSWSVSIPTPGFSCRASIVRKKGKITAEGRYRLWKEMWTLAYLVNRWPDTTENDYHKHRINNGLFHLLKVHRRCRLFG